MFAQHVKHFISTINNKRYEMNNFLRVLELKEDVEINPSTIIITHHSITNKTKNKNVKRSILSGCLSFLIGFVTILLVIGFAWNMLVAKDAFKVKKVVINVSKLIHRTDKKFLSVALDSSLIRRGWIQDHLRSKKLLLLASHLSPGYLRVGGTAADCLIFNLMSDGRVEQDLMSDGRVEQDLMSNGRVEQDYTNLGQSYIREDGGECGYEGNACLQERCNDFTMSVSTWDLINEFAINTGLDLLFDLNVLLRDGNMWNSTNAKDLIDYSHERNYSVIWQLGNEPNSFPHVFNTSISGTQLADDFAALRLAIESHSASKEPMVVGPDVTSPRGLVTTPLTFLQEFLEAQNDSINAVTWHQYYMNGRIATLKDFTEPSIFNTLHKQILEVQQVMTKTNTSLPLWLSETSSAYGSGAPGLSDRFVAGFLWLDKLGMAARMGLKVVIRQSLYGGHYSLLDLDTLDPNPDWWVSVVYRSFVGRDVLDTPIPSNSLRLYCHCAPPHWPGAVTLFAINIDADSSAFLDVGALRLKDSSPHVFSYVLTAGGNDLLSKTVLMNGKTLKLNPDGSLPPFRPKIVSPSKLVVAPLSMAFFVFPHVGAEMCQGG